MFGKVTSKFLFGGLGGGGHFLFYILSPSCSSPVSRQYPVIISFEFQLITYRRRFWSLYRPLRGDHLRTFVRGDHLRPPSMVLL